MRTLTTFAILILFTFYAHVQGQTVAMDFTRTDCDGVDHHLFSELDAGKVVILDFVMLGCSSCIVATDALKQIAEPFDNTYPGRVQLYEFGYIKNYTCEQLLNWQTQYHLRGSVFEDGASQVGYYGGMGMPTIVVVATNNHTVLYKKQGYAPSDHDAIIAAITQGLQYSPQGIKDDLLSKGIAVYPTIFSEHFYVTNPLPEQIILNIYDIRGKRVMRQEIGNAGTMTVPGSSLMSGMYSIVAENSHGILGSIKVIKK